MFAIGESRFLSSEINEHRGSYDETVCGMVNEQWGRLSRSAYAFGARRHGRKYNQLFCDRHVLAIDPWVLFNPTNTGAMWNSAHQPHSELWEP